jgi:hypothetical protein
MLTASAVIAATPNQLTEEDKAGGWKLLFDGQSGAGWHSFRKKSFPAKGWIAEEGWLHGLGKGGGDLISDAEFKDFELQWEWKIAPNGNSGVKIFVTETRDSPLGHEYQMIDDARRPVGKTTIDKHSTASFYDVLKPEVVPTKPAGEINESRIVVQENKVEHWLNGKKVLEYSCASEAVKTAVAASKFKDTPGFGNKIKGHILLQDHSTEVWFRNIRVRELSGK